MKSPPAVKQKSVFVQAFCFIDVRVPSDFTAAIADHASATSDGDGSPELFPCSRQQAITAFLAAGWEGDGAVEPMWVPPFACPSGTGSCWGHFLWHVKQCNNGISWILAKEPWDYPSLNDNGHWQQIPLQAS